MFQFSRILGAVTPKKAVAAAAVPDGMRFYVVGDIHGRVDLLRTLHERIRADSAALPGNTRKILICLGDYIDRGYESRAVLDLLIGNPLPDFEPVFLKGNHEDVLLRFLKDPVVGRGWFAIGGRETLLSYGVSVPPGVATPERLQDIQRRLKSALPKEHLDFISKLRLSHEAGDYFFVHAGIRPGRSLARQDPGDLLWSRDDFLRSEKTHAKIIVHGHSITSEPEVRANRIGIDTGAYSSNRLTCLVLEGQSRAFLQTA